MTIIPAERRGKLRLGALAAAAVALALLIPPGQAASAHTSTRTIAADAGVKPSIVLVHGAWGDSANWEKPQRVLVVGAFVERLQLRPRPARPTR